MLGIIAFSKLGVDLLPNVVLLHLMVQTTCNNTTPEEIEKLVYEPIESAVRTIPGVKDIKSVPKEGVSIISINSSLKTQRKIEEIVDENYTNPQFDINSLSDELKISRVYLNTRCNFDCGY